MYQSMYQLFARSFIGLAIMVLPMVSQAVDDTRITSISMTSQSDSTPATAATYELTVVTSATISANEQVNFMVNNDLEIDGTFDFTNTTFSGTIIGTSSLPYPFVYSITLNSDLTAGTHTITLTNVINGTTEGNKFAWGVNSGSSLGSGVPVTVDPNKFSIGEDELTLFVFGTNIAVSWTAYAGASTYSLILSDDEPTYVGAETSYVFTNLEPETTYYIDIIGYDTAGGSIVLPYQTVSTTTEQPISKTRYTKPTVPKKKIKATTATVNWTVGDEVDYIDSFSLKLKLKNKTVKTYKNISADTLSKKLKKLKPEKKYTVQLRALYSTDEMTKWSKLVSFKTKAE